MAQDAITITGIEQYQEALRKMQTDNPATKKELQAIIRRAISEARKNIVKDAQDILENDPRNAYKAVRSSVYRSIFGGQVNIISSRRRGAPTVNSLVTLVSQRFSAARASVATSLVRVLIELSWALIFRWCSSSA